MNNLATLNYQSPIATPSFQPITWWPQPTLENAVNNNYNTQVLTEYNSTLLQRLGAANRDMGQHFREVFSSNMYASLHPFKTAEKAEGINKWSAYLSPVLNAGGALALGATTFATGGTALAAATMVFLSYYGMRFALGYSKSILDSLSYGFQTAQKNEIAMAKGELMRYQSAIARNDIDAALLHNTLSEKHKSNSKISSDAALAINASSGAVMSLAGGNLTIGVILLATGGAANFYKIKSASYLENLKNDSFADIFEIQTAEDRMNSWSKVEKVSAILQFANLLLGAYTLVVNNAPIAYKSVDRIVYETRSGDALALSLSEERPVNVAQLNPSENASNLMHTFGNNNIRDDSVPTNTTANISSSSNSNLAAANPVYGDGIINLENYILVGRLGNLISTTPTELTDATLKDYTGWWSANDSHVTAVPYIRVEDFSNSTLVSATQIGTIDAVTTAGDPVHHIQNVNLGADTGRVILLPTDSSGNILPYVDANLLRLAMSDHKEIGVDIVWKNVDYNGSTYVLPYQVYEVSDLQRLDNSGVAYEKDFTIAWTQIPEAVLKSEFTNIITTSNAAYLIDLYAVAPSVGLYNDFILRADRDSYGNMGPFTMRNGGVSETLWQLVSPGKSIQKNGDAFSTIFVDTTGTEFKDNAAFESTYMCSAVENSAESFFTLTWRDILGISAPRAEPNVTGNSGTSDYHTRAVVCDVPVLPKINIPPSLPSTPGGGGEDGNNPTDPENQP